MSQQQLSARQEQLVMENRNLVLHVINQKFKVPSALYNDVISVGTLGLVKAAVAFDEARGYKFSSLACKYIHTELVKFFASENPHLSEQSIDREDENHWSQKNYLSTQFNFSEKLEEYDFIASILTLIFNNFKLSDCALFFYMIGGYSGKKIAKICGFSFQNFYLRKERINARIKSFFLRKNPPNVNQQIKVDYQNNYYHISFFKEYFDNLNDIFSIVMKDLGNSDISVKLWINYENDRITIILPVCEEESFLILANIAKTIAQKN